MKEGTYKLNEWHRNRNLGEQQNIDVKIKYNFNFLAIAGWAHNCETLKCYLIDTWMKSWSEWFVVLHLSRIRFVECHLLEIAAKKSEKNHLEQRTFQIKSQQKFKYHLCVTILLSSINYFFFRIPVLEGNIWFSKESLPGPEPILPRKLRSPYH